MNRKRIIISVIALLLLWGLALAQRPQRPNRKPQYTGTLKTEVPKNDQDLSGRFTFVRIRYADLSGCSGFGPWLGDDGLPWSHDYPIAGRHLMKIMAELSKIDATIDVDEPIFTFDDPQLFKYPFAYLCEVGCMNLSEKELAGLREYILRGGFLLIDDFRSPWQLQNLQRQLRQALAGIRVEKNRHFASDFQLLLFDQDAGCQPGLPRLQSRILGNGRQGRAADDDHQLQLRCERLLAIFG